jgi:ATP-dependent DNA ligase
MSENPFGNFTLYEPQLVHKAPEKGFKDPIYKEKIIATVKKDGSYYRLVKENNQVFLFSRTVSKSTGFYVEKIDNVPHIKEWAQKYLPNGTCIIGEIYYPGGTSKDTVTVMGSLPQRAIDLQADKGNIHFYIHDILKYNGYDYVVNQIDYDHRYSDVCKHIDIETPLIPEIEIASCIDNTYCNLERCLDDTLAQGEEGLVMRLENGLYLPGKRNKNMWKIKEHIDSLDFVVMGLLDPEKEYTGKNPESWQYWETKLDDSGEEVIETNIPVTKDYFLGLKNGLKLGAYDAKYGELQYIARVTSGISDADKKDMTAHPEKWIGHVASVSCMSVDKQAKTLRHPAFLCLREDKNPNECLVSDIFGD